MKKYDDFGKWAEKFLGVTEFWLNGKHIVKTTAGLWLEI